MGIKCTDPTHTRKKYGCLDCKRNSAAARRRAHGIGPAKRCTDPEHAKLGRNKDGHCTKCRRADALRRRYDNPELAMWKGAKQRAKRAGLPFTITSAGIVIPECCPWLGIALEAAHGKRKPHNGSPSLDKIVPELGYVKGNIIVISKLANQIKNSGTPEQVMAVALGLRRTYKAAGHGWMLLDADTEPEDPIGSHWGDFCMGMQ